MDREDHRSDGKRKEPKEKTRGDVSRAAGM